MGKENQSYTLPILPLFNIVIFPTLAMPLTIKKTASIKAIEVALASENKMIAIFTQKDATDGDPQPADIRNSIKGSGLRLTYV